MKRSIPQISSGKKSGAALVLVLAFTVLLAGLVLAFFTQATRQQQITDSNIEGALAEVIARSAVEVVTGDLKQEIADGSTPLGSPAIYAPLDASKIMPARAGVPATSPAPIPNLLKRSAATVPFYPNGVVRASASSTSTPSRDGRFINAERWNASYLAPKLNTGSDDAIPVAAFQVPDWIVVTANGATAKTTGDLTKLRDASDPDYALGRFAYLIFDQGGLLDMNVAGYPGGLGTDKVRGKTSLAFSDLAIFKPTSSALGQTNSDRIVGWRNFATAKADGVFPPANPSFAALDPYYDYVMKNRDGFLKVPATTHTNNQTDQRFLSRQELIALRRSLGFSVNALQFMTHFTRELNAPSWAPTYDASEIGGSGPYSYKTDSSNPSAINPLVPNVRYANGGTITTYRNDGSSFTYQVKAGDPVVQRRFPLGRLAWIGRNGPQNGGNATNIKACFGLQWNPTNLAWEYTGPGGSVVGADMPIKRLDQINATREPDFFELLKAGVLAGATGLRPANPAIGTYPSSASPFGPIPDYNKLKDRQIFQLGANIIDQSDADSYPTRLDVGTTFESPAVVAGSENIPYLYQLTAAPYRPAADRDNFNFWLEPVFWNPYVSAAPVTDTPEQYVVRLDRGRLNGVLHPTNSTQPSGFDTINAQPSLVPPAQISLGRGSLSNTLSEAGTSPTYLSQLLDGGASVTVTQPNGYGSNGIYTAEKSGNAVATSYAGFWLGKVNRPSLSGNSVSSNSGGGSSSAKFTLLADYGGGKLLEVQRMDLGDVNAFWTGGITGTSLGRRINRWGFNDPRTGRFGVIDTPPGNTTALLNQSNYWTGSSSAQSAGIPKSNANNVTVDPDLDASTKWTRLDAFHFGDNTTSAIYFKDADGVQRSGDGTWISDTSNSLPMRSEAKYRPLILNRPFRNVGELGYVFSDVPWRSADLSSPKSADAGLLDLFTVADNAETSFVAGKINLNTPHQEIVKTLLAGATIDEQGGSALTTTQVDDLAAAITAFTSSTATGKGPLMNKAELATRLMSDPAVLAAFGTAATDDRIVKARREAAVRALSQVGQTRTWNLLIDIVAQSGRFARDADTMDKFIVKGERRYWVHLAIDRFTGEVVDRQIETVIE